MFSVLLLITMKKRGRPKVKKSEFKKPFPMRFSDAELKAFKAAAGEAPVRDWMRKILVMAAGIISSVDTVVEDAATGSLIRVPGIPGSKAGGLKQGGRFDYNSLGKAQESAR
jgi:hypothetical protein